MLTLAPGMIPSDPFAPLQKNKQQAVIDAKLSGYGFLAGVIQ